MRRVFFILATLTAFIVCTSIGCKHDDGLIVTPAVIPAPPGPAAGNWIVSTLTIRTVNMDHHLDGYTFTFKAGGVVSVDTKITIVNGTWVTKVDNNSPKLIMALVNADPMLAELNQDWIIIANTDSTLALTRGAGYTASEIHFIRQ